MLELGVHDDGDAALLGEGHRALDHPLRQRALVVVLDEHRIGVRHGRVQLAEQLILGARRDRVLHFFIDTHHLLAAGGDARLRRGGARGGDDDVAVGEPVLCQLGAQRVASRVVPDHRDQPALGADRRHVRGYVGRPAQRGAPRVHRHHRHRGFGRDPLRVAREIDVEHRIAHDDDAPRRHLREQLLEVVAGEPGFGLEGRHCRALANPNR